MLSLYMCCRSQQKADEINGFLIAAAMPINFNFCRAPVEFVFELAHYFRTWECTGSGAKYFRSTILTTTKISLTSKWVFHWKVNTAGWNLANPWKFLMMLMLIPKWQIQFEEFCRILIVFACQLYIRIRRLYIYDFTIIITTGPLFTTWWIIVWWVINSITENIFIKQK